MSVTAPPLDLGDLLRRSGLDEREVLVFRHRPTEAKLNAVFDWLVEERPDLFDSYQSTHAPRTEAALKRARYIAAFVRHRPGTALFVGFYEVASFRTISTEVEMARPLHRELMMLGMTGMASEGRDSVLEFDLRRTEWHADWRGRLVVRWPGLERSWYRWAERNTFEVEAIAPESLLVQPMPRWDEIALEWHQLKALPSRWAGALEQWRGVYLIVDQSDGRQYVGSAYGAANILQRWRHYALTGHGDNALLRQRDPSGFRFSILQRVSPDLPEHEVIAIEQSWKHRLRSRAPHGLNAN